MLLLPLLSVPGIYAQRAPFSAARLHASVERNPQRQFVYRFVVEQPPNTSRAGKLTIDSVVVQPASGGFTLTSPAPPAIRPFKLTPRIDPTLVPIMPPGDDPGDGDRYNQELAHYADAQSVAGMTLGPAPAVMPDAVLLSLAGDIDRAKTLGWFRTDSAAKNVRAQLESARIALSRRDAAGARNILQLLRQHVSGPLQSDLTGEAAMLVDLNCGYLLEKTAF